MFSVKIKVTIRTKYVKMLYKYLIGFRYSPENPDMLTTLGLLYMQVSENTTKCTK